MDRSRKAIEPNGSNCFSSVSIPDFLSLGLGLEPLSPALDLPMANITYLIFKHSCLKELVRVKTTTFSYFIQVAYFCTMVYNVNISTHRIATHLLTKSD